VVPGADRGNREDRTRSGQAAVEKRCGTGALDALTLRALKKKGFSDRRLAKLLKTTEKAVREQRRALGVRPVYKRVDTCAAEFATNTAYHVFDLRG
jgi:carbamoyl-phosphate synthase large subunit